MKPPVSWVPLAHRSMRHFTHASVTPSLKLCRYRRRQLPPLRHHVVLPPHLVAGFDFSESDALVDAHVCYNGLPKGYRGVTLSSGNTESLYWFMQRHGCSVSSLLLWEALWQQMGPLLTDTRFGCHSRGYHVVVVLQQMERALCGFNGQDNCTEAGRMPFFPDASPETRVALDRFLSRIVPVLPFVRSRELLENIVLRVVSDQAVDPSFVFLLTQRLLALYHRPVRDESAADSSSRSKLEVIARIVQKTVPHHVESVVAALSESGIFGTPAGLQPAPQNDTNELIASHSAQLCLRHISAIIRQRKVAGDGMLPSSVFQRLHWCVMRIVSVLSFLPANHPERSNLAAQSMICYKYATLPQLCQLFGYLESQHVATFVVQNKFLAHCGAAVPFSAHPILHQRCIPRYMHDMLCRAFDSLQCSKRDVMLIEEGLVHGCGSMCALGHYKVVREVYQRFPSLRETPHSVMAYVRLGRVADAISSLAVLGASRSEGWVRLPTPVYQAVVAVCRLAGSEGTPADVPMLYDAVVSFHNAGMIVSQLLESVLAGICDRIAGLSKTFENLASTPPRRVLGYVIPILRSVVAYIGDDINSDMLLGLIEEAVRAESVAVPLTVAVVVVLQQASAISIADMFARADASTGNVPFLYYYALCYARDISRRDTLDHLAAVWHVDPSLLLCRDALLCPQQMLWQCVSCRRLNSSRFNYCICSALRNAFVLCRHCGYGQDGRWPSCLSCGTIISQDDTLTTVVRVAWNCIECGACNPARQVRKCFRCAKPTGPVITHPGRSRGLNSTVCDERRRSFCGCIYDAYTERVGYCHRCGRFKHKHAAQESTVWRCVGCRCLRSSLERTCPSCPQVDFLPFAFQHNVTAKRLCGHCGATVVNPFALVCPHCGEEDVRVCQAPLSPAQETMPHVGREALVGPVSSSENVGSGYACRHCGTVKVTDLSTLLHSANALSCCAECHAPMEEDWLIRVGDRKCDHCRSSIEPHCIAAVCPFCHRFVPPVEQEGWSWATAVGTCKALVAVDLGSESKHIGSSCRMRNNTVSYSKLVDVLQVLLAEWSHRVEIEVLRTVRVEVVVAMGRLLSKLAPQWPTEPLARRAAALVKQLLTTVSERCGNTACHYASEQLCRECLGGHPSEVCGYHTALWTCHNCGAEHSNNDLRRYLCLHCLAIRPEVQELCPTECWQCAMCRRANLEFETYCIYCGLTRDAVSVWNEPESKGAGAATKDSCEGRLVGGSPFFVQTRDKTLRWRIPFSPAKCSICRLVYLETQCPICSSGMVGVADTKGFVCFVSERYALIQPVDTGEKPGCVYVDEHLLRRTPLSEGKLVHYRAVSDWHGSMRATRVHADGAHI